MALRTRSDRFLIFFLLAIFLLVPYNQNLADMMARQLNFLQFRIDTLDSFGMRVDQVDGYLWVTDVECVI